MLQPDDTGRGNRTVGLGGEVPVGPRPELIVVEGDGQRCAPGLNTGHGAGRGRLQDGRCGVGALGVGLRDLVRDGRCSAGGRRDRVIRGGLRDLGGWGDRVGVGEH